MAYWKLTKNGVESCEDNRHAGLLVARSETEDGGIVLSTIFLGVSASVMTPRLFETAVLVRGGDSEVLGSYRTLEEAFDGHGRHALSVFSITAHRTSYGPIKVLFPV